jgi:CheY-like chemotaxis protein
VAALVLGHLGVEASRLRDLEEDGDVPLEKTALVCEDEALFQVAISEALEKLGFQVETAKSKQESLEALGRKSFGLVTVDNRFPDDAEGGYAILQQINAMNPEVRRRMTVAFISADLSTMDTQSAFILGANLTVSKKDVRRLDQILLQGIREHRNAYKVFQEVQEEILRSTL